MNLTTYADALREIINIPNRLNGGDWDEIEEARAIARKALGIKVHVIEAANGRCRCGELVPQEDWDTHVGLRSKKERVE